uniref:Uncharacterized protein n=1 Tax=Anguilla anguilla TaxID=7936 RepID=A0A0E9THC3_ANGAN
MMVLFLTRFIIRYPLPV